MPEIISRANAKAAGLTRYFSGQPCPQGHVVERYVTSASCVVCSCEQARQWQAADPKSHREQARRWRATHPEYDRDRRAAHPAERREYNREYARERRANDPVYKLTVNLRVRILKALAGKSKSASILALLGCDPAWFLAEVAPKLLADASAKYGVEMTLGNYGKVWQWDHLEPFAGVDITDPAWQRSICHYGNLRPLPVAVNLSKGAKVPDPAEVWVALPKQHKEGN